MSKTIISILAIFFVCLATFQSASAASAPEYTYMVEVTDTRFQPPTIYAGDIVNMEVDIRSRASETPLVGLEAELDLGEQFKEIKVVDSIDYVRAGETKTLVFEFEAKVGISSGYYSMPLTITYLSGSDLREQSHVVLVPISKTEKSLDITIDPNVVNPGRPTQVVFTIKNLGNASVSNISFSWTEENDLVLPLGSDNKRYIDILTANQEAELSYNVAADPNIETGIYPLDISITFNDIDATRTETSQVGLIVGGATEFEVSAEVLSSGQVSISIANVGSNNAEAVVVRIPEQQGVSISGSNTSILGNLNRGDFTLANFEMSSVAMTRPTQESMPVRPSTVSDEDSGRRTLLVQIDYTDTTGERQSVQKNLEMNFVVSSEDGGTLQTGFAGRTGRQSANQNNSIIAWVLLVLIIVGAAAFNKFKAGSKSWKRLGKLLAPIAALFLVVIFLFDSNLVATILATLAAVLALGWFFQEKHVLVLLNRTVQYAKKYLE